MHFPLLVWEQRKLEDVAKIIGGGTPSTKIKEYWNGNINWYAPIEIGNQTFVSSSRKKISELGLKKSSAKLLPGGKTILFTSRAGIGDMAIMKTDGSTNQGFQSWVVRSNLADVYFLYSLGKKLKKQALRKASGSTFLEISNSEVKKLLLFIPSFSEQKDISKVFKLIDKLISLQQRKLKLFDQLRKTLLEYLISEQKIPIVRFNSFRKEWKVFRLQNLIIKTTKGKAKADMVGNRSIYLDTAYLNGGALSTVDAPTDVYKDDIVILWDGSLAGKVYHGFSGALGSTLKSFTPKYSGEYLFQYLQRSQEKIFKNYRTPNIPHVVKDFITIFKVNAPSLEEQNKISTILESIDLLIDNQNTKIKKWKKIKEHLLQKMFI
ncbi:restriction endonuclease subunit S [Lactobacillus johnsonii]|uniref:restriction endonuclease subunit S n=1 Tax=Lactobacillus johnsonii TaxID=33959 RepID=UPI001FB35C44|nr:restriction endonuclease subunit S [Lactobacillus johnsonii]UOC05529.1 restriction endonuclease subunit S [Lactobacillus johnsonii]